MRTYLYYLWICLLLGGMTGCTTTMRADYPVPVVSDSEGLAGQNRKKASEDEDVSADKLKNLSAAQHLAQGEKALARQDHSLAKLHFTLALAKDEKLLEAYLGLGESLTREGNFTAAISVLNKALDESPKCVPALTRLGILYRLQGKNGQAIDIFQRANQLAPGGGWLVTEIGITYEQDGNAAKAEDYFWKSIELLPESPEALNNLGFNLLVQEKYGTAIPVLEKALRMAPDNQLVRNNLALAYAFDGRHRQALQAFETTVGAAGAYNNLGYLLMLQESPGEAEKALRQAMELSPVFYARAKENLQLLEGTVNRENRLFD